MKGLVNIWLQLIQREQRLYWRDRITCLHACLFFIMLVVFVPLTLPPEPELLRKTAPGIIWIALLLAFFLASERLFQIEYEAGILEQWFLYDTPLYLFISAKLITHWGLTIIPMLLFCPLLAILFQFNFDQTTALALSMLVGSPSILALCALAAAFGGHIKQNGLVMAMSVLPLTIPIMILGSSTTTHALEGLNVWGELALLLALSILSMTLLPFAMSGVIRLSWSD